MGQDQSRSTAKPNWGHAVCIPIVGLYYLYINRDELLKQPARPAWTGLLVTLVGLAAFAYGIWPGQNQFFQGCAMILTLFGIVLMLSGWQIMKFAWFPIAFLICGIPWPALVYSYIASPLQTLRRQGRGRVAAVHRRERVSHRHEDQHGRHHRAAANAQRRRGVRRDCAR